jgi:L-aspartate oxidase
MILATERGRGYLTSIFIVTYSTDYLVIGSGLAGLSFALNAAEYGQVLVVTKRTLMDSATSRAQGGVAAVLSPHDSFEGHVADTVTAGAGLCRTDVVEALVREGPSAIEWLLDRGVRLSRDSGGELDLGREGGHTTRRVAHAGDVTGQEIQRALVEAVRGAPNIRLLESHMAVDLINQTRFGRSDQCVGAYVLDEKAGTVHTMLARATVLATGGAGKVYLYTSNPDISSGDGVSMAYRAGAEVANMEFYQFHPTCLFDPRAKNFLLSEALRGEGAILRLPSGEPFMQRHHPMADLAPRDVVARAMDFEMKRTGSDYVLLDITQQTSGFVRDRFPNLCAECDRYGYDLAREPVPVVPAAHYMCGGVTTDVSGRTSLPGLWAIGETACTGLHGANRLASNSLMEAVVVARRAADRLKTEVRELRQSQAPDVPDWEVGEAVPSDEAVVVTHNWDELRRLMWNYVGIVRSDGRLRRAEQRVALLKREIQEYYWRHLVTRDMLELRNLATVADIIISSAACRRESRGLHFNIDCAETVPDCAVDTVAKRGLSPHLRRH